MKRPIILHLFALPLVVCLALSAPLSAQYSDSITNHFTFLAYGQLGYSISTTTNQGVSNGFSINNLEVMGIARFADKWSAICCVAFKMPVTLKEVYISYEALPELAFRIGQFKTPFSIENQIPPFINDILWGPSQPTRYFAGISGDPHYYGTTGREIGFEVYGRFLKGKIAYNAAIMNGNGINNWTNINPKMLGLAIHYKPVEAVQITASYTGGEHHSMKSEQPYKRHRASIGCWLQSKRIDIVGEYMCGKDNKIVAMGGYLTSTIHLPHRFDIVVATDYLQQNIAEASFLATGSLGVQYWFYKQCRWQLAYQYQHLHNVLSAIGSNLSGHLVATQLQVVF